MIENYQRAMDAHQAKSVDDSVDRARMKQLRQIEKWNTALSNPASVTRAAAIAWSAIIFVALQIISCSTFLDGLDSLAWLFMLAAVVCGYTVFFTVSYTMDTRAWLLKKIDLAITQYQPADATSFVTLQRKTQLKGEIDQSSVTEWISSERTYIERRHPNWARNQKGSSIRFLNKEVAASGEWPSVVRTRDGHVRMRARPSTQDKMQQ